MDVEHKLFHLNGVRIHAAMKGEGPLVILLHGFPESWYSWRWQIEALASAGFRAVAIDQRGYGRSSKFRKQSAYRITRLVDDVVNLIDAFGERTAVVVGHDWGAPVAWTTAWLHPNRITGVVGMSVPFSARAQIALPGSPFGERRPDDIHAALAPPGSDFYQVYFGAQDGIIDECEADLRSWLCGVVYSLSGDYLAQAATSQPADWGAVERIRNGPLCIPHGGQLRDALVQPDAMPDWFSETDLDFFYNEFQRSGLVGPLSYYRNMDANWQELEPWADKPVVPPSLFIGGAYDVATDWGQEGLAGADKYLTNHAGDHILDDCGHWIQQEYPEATNALLLDFLERVG